MIHVWQFIAIGVVGIVIGATALLVDKWQHKKPAQDSFDFPKTNADDLPRRGAAMSRLTP